MNSRYERCEELHDQAMRWSNDGRALVYRGDADEAQAAFEKAWRFERDAAMDLVSEENFEPSRSILFRSAASLALRCGEVHDARKLALLGLAGEPSDRVRESLLAILTDAEARARANATLVASVRTELHELIPDADVPEPIDVTWKRSA